MILVLRPQPTRSGARSSRYRPSRRRESSTSKRYEGMLRQMRMTPDVFEQEMSEDITTHEVQAFIKGRAVVTEDEILTDYHLNRDQIKVAYVVFDPKSFEDKVTVAETDLRSFLPE